MLLHEGHQILRPALEGAIDMEDNDESLSSASSSPRPSEDADAKDEPVIDNTKEITNNKTTQCKKRVQFLPDGILVRIRVIPPRSNKSSSDSDCSATDSSDSDDSDSETVTDSEDFSSDRDTPSPAVSIESKNKFATMPPLSYAAKGSYNVSKPSNKNGLLVAKITGLNQIASPPQPSGKAKKSKRIGSPKIERGPKKNTKVNDKVDNGKKSPDENKTKARKKRVPLKFKEGKISPPPPASKSSKTPSAPKPSAKLTQRRLSNTSNVNKSVTAKRSHTSTISTSVKPLTTPSPSTSPDMSLERVSRAMQSLSMGKLYTFDGFIFPPHHANELHLPELAVTSKSEDFSQPVNVDLPSPRRSLQGNIHQQSNQSLSPTSQQQSISPSSANRKRRHYAWQMANGNIQNTLNNTPNISQLWDNIPVHSDLNDKISLNCHKQL